MSFLILPPLSPGFGRLSRVLALATLVLTVAYFGGSARKPSEEDSVSIFAQIYEDQVHDCRKNAISNSSECVAEAERIYRASVGQVYRPKSSDIFLDWSICAVAGAFLSCLTLFAVRAIGFVFGTLARSTGSPIPEPKRLILNYEAPMVAHPFSNSGL
jgi:hypothetical protein